MAKPWRRHALSFTGRICLSLVCMWCSHLRHSLQLSQYACDPGTLYMVKEAVRLVCLYCSCAPSHALPETAKEIVHTLRTIDLAAGRAATRWVVHVLDREAPAGPQLHRHSLHWEVVFPEAPDTASPGSPVGQSHAPHSGRVPREPLGRRQ